jgi:hypothetical protein
MCGTYTPLHLSPIQTILTYFIACFSNRTWISGVQTWFQSFGLFFLGESLRIVDSFVDLRLGAGVDRIHSRYTSSLVSMF